MIKTREERSSKSLETLTDPKWGKHKFISVNGESMRSVSRKLLDSWHIHESAWVVLSSGEMMNIFFQEMMRMMKMKLLMRWWCWTVKTQGYVSTTLRLAEKMLLFFSLFTDSQSSGLSSNPLLSLISGEHGKSPETCCVEDFYSWY